MKLTKKMIQEINNKKDTDMNGITYIQCAKCGAKLCKETDSYRFNENGEPICYDCAEEDTATDAEAKVVGQTRNCDVGTADEQSARFDAHCRKHMGCFTCPLREKDGGVPKHCELAWAQMPYGEGGAK